MSFSKLLQFLCPVQALNSWRKSMNHERLNNYFLALAAIAVLVVWVVFILFLRGLYAAQTLVDPLAMIDILFPYYWVILLFSVSLCIIALLRKNSPRWLHVLMLTNFALLLFYTPFLLGGFSWSPDAFWHGGIANYMPSIIAGAKYPLTDYAQNYPLSFLITYGALNVLQTNILTYNLYIFPVVFIFLFTALSYLFISRITDKTTAALALLIAFPALHYIEPHVSPFATGTIFVLGSLALLTYRGLKFYVLNAALMVLLVLVHPISPLFLIVYLFFIVIFGSFNYKTGKLYKNSRKIAFSLLLLLSVSWFLWTYFEAASNYVGITAPFYRVISFEFLNSLSGSVQWTTGGQGFIFPLIGQLSLFVYAAVGLLIVLVCGPSILFFFLKKGFDYTLRIRLQLAFAALGSAAIGYLLFSSSGERFLLGRGLLFFLLFGSITIAAFATNTKIKSKTLVPFLVPVVLFLAVTFPVVAYSKESYNTFTPQACEVLSFIGAKMDLTNKTISMGYDQQLASYVDLSKGFKLVGFPPDMEANKPDIIVLRLNYYYLLAMRYEFSFSNNSYTQIQTYLANCTDYNLVFSNPQSQVWEIK
jgi:hypothetical protein